MKNKCYAVLSGDLVDSSRLASGESQRAMQWLREAAGRLANAHPGCVEGTLDTFRHDSWQLLMGQPSLCLRAAVYLRTALKLHSDRSARFDTRISIGIGAVDVIAESRVSDSRGPAFTISGRNLDAMGRNRLVFEAQEVDAAAPSLLGQVAVPLLDCLVSDWSPTVAHAIHGTIEGLTQDEVARSLPPNPRTDKPVSRQAVSDSLHRGHWRAVKAVLNNLEKNRRIWRLPGAEANTRACL